MISCLTWFIKFVLLSIVLLSVFQYMAGYTSRVVYSMKVHVGGGRTLVMYRKWAAEEHPDGWEKMAGGRISRAAASSLSET